MIAGAASDALSVRAGLGQRAQTVHGVVVDVPRGPRHGRRLRRPRHAAAPAPIDSYMQYFAKLAAAASSASAPGHDDPAGRRRDDALMQPRVKEQAGAAADASS